MSYSEHDVVDSRGRRVHVRTWVFDVSMAPWVDRDTGDEDDGEAHPDRWLHVRLAGWCFMLGPTRIYYPAERMPTLPDHDPGDEEPRLRRLRFMSYMEGL